MTQEISKIFREKKIDLVHVRSRAPAWSAIFAAKKIGIPVLTTWHGHVSNSSFIKKIYNSIMLKGDAVIANSAYTAERISKIYNIDLNKIDIISRGVNVESFKGSKFSNIEISNMKKMWSVDDNKIIILFPARLTRWKGHLVTIEAINLGLLDNKQVQRKIHSKEDQYLAREYLLSKSAKKDKAHFSEKEISTIINQLKLEHKVKIYDDNLDRLFQRNEIQN